MEYKLFPFIEGTKDKEYYFNINYDEYSYDLDLIDSNSSFYIPKGNLVIFNKKITLEGKLINDGHLILRDEFSINGGYFLNRGNVSIIIDDFNNIRYGIEHVLDRDLLEDDEFTGFIIDREIKPEDISVLISFPKESMTKWEKKFNNDEKINFYFSENFSKKIATKINPGMGLYWNSKTSGLKIYKDWIIKIIFRV